MALIEIGDCKTESQLHRRIEYFRSGINSGNGGFVEVSGKENLIFRGEVDTSAPHGNLGTLLLDPQNIEVRDTINTSGRDISIMGASITTGGIDSTLKWIGFIVAAGDISLSSSNGNITTAKLDAGGGNLSLTSNNGDITTANLVSTTRLNGGGDITLVAEGNINTNQLDSGSNGLGNGGDISLDAKGDINVSKTIESDSFPGNGGNITINAPFIVAVPTEDSDITANAFTGNGGRITIFSQAIFGLKFRPSRTHLSDITVSSTGGGIDGIFELNTLGIDPSRGLITLPNEPVNTEIDEGCQGSGGLAKVEFFPIGYGGLPPAPDEPFEPDFDELVSGMPELEQESNRMVSQSHRCSVHP